jgi:chemotaxis protein histidine kinase CheA
MSRLDKALAELAAEKPEETKPTEPKPEETQTEQPSETPEEKPEEKPEETEQPAEQTEDKPEDKSEPEPKPKKEIPDDPMKRAEYSFRRQLDKNNKKHADELAARDKEIAELKARFAEIEKKTDPNNAIKTRDQFPNDDEFINYLVKGQVDAILAERDAEAKKKADADAETQRKQKEIDDEASEQQRVWMENVHAAFNDEKREQEFYAKVQYCSQRGLGQILDECPAAADFLMNHPHGPRVMEKVLNDQQTFRDVFGDGSRRVSQLDVYYALRRVDERMDDAPAAPATTAAPTKPTMPHLGKPGKQAGGGVKPDIYSDPDEMRAFVRRFK